MIIYVVIGTAPAFMGKSIAEAGCMQVLHSFVAPRGDTPTPLPELAELMLSKMEVAPK